MQLRLAPLPTVLLFHAFSLVQATNFTFSFGDPTQCDNFPVSWIGGTPPFELVLTPAFGTSRTFSVPAESFSNGKGSFQAQLPFEKGKKFLAAMSDASGFGSGGTSDVLVVGPSVSNANCNTTDPGVDFTFDLDTSLAQCTPYIFSGYAGAVQPVTIWGVVPGGTSFILNPPVGSTSFSWTANVAEGTSLLFMMTDSKGRKGGSSDILQVSASNIATCLDAQSPVSLSNAPSETATSSASSTSTSATGTSTNSPLPASGDTSKKSSNTGAIVGGILAGLVALATIIVLIVFLWRRRRRSDPYNNGAGFGRSYGGSHTHRLESMDLDPPSSMGDVHSPSAVIQPYPFAAPGVLSTAAGSGAVSFNASPSAQNLLAQPQQAQEAAYEASQFSTLHNPYSPVGSLAGAAEQMGSQHGRHLSDESGQASSSGDASSSSMSSAMRRKAAMAGMPSYRPTPRYIVHTDLEEVQPQEEGEVIELPPQYSERRAPIAGLTPPPGLDYALPPPPPPPRPLPNPLESDHGESSARLPQPIEPGPPTPTSAQRFASS